MVLWGRCVWLRLGLAVVRVELLMRLWVLMASCRLRRPRFKNRGYPFERKNSSADSHRWTSQRWHPRGLNLILRPGFAPLSVGGGSTKIDRTYRIFSA